jgi:hypothetical protein
MSDTARTTIRPIIAVRPFETKQSDIPSSKEYAARPGFGAPAALKK